MRSSLRCVVVVSVLALGLSTQAAAISSRAKHPTPRQVVHQEETGVLHMLWNALTSLWGKDGVRIDPNG